MAPKTVRAKHPTGRSKVAYDQVENSATPVFVRCVTVRLGVSAFDPSSSLHQKIVSSRWQSTITDAFTSGRELIANNQAPQDGTISGSVLPVILRRQRIGNR
jgi:hypothetical protein